jgi:hypothetical protein
MHVQDAAVALVEASALVDDHCKRVLAVDRAERLRVLLRAVHARRLLVEAEAEDDAARRREALLEERLDRDHDPHQPGLVVGRAAAPDALAIVVARVWRMSPLVNGRLVDRHDVLVCEEQERLEGRVRALPDVDEAVSVRLGQREVLVPAFTCQYTADHRYNP